MRVIRILVYEGDADVIDRTMRQAAVKKYHEITGMRIYEEIIGYQYPTIQDIPSHLTSEE